MKSGLVIAPPKTRRSRRSVQLPAFLFPHLRRQRDDQARRRQVIGESWHDENLVIDRGDGTGMVAVGDFAGSTQQWLPIWRAKVQAITFAS